MRHGLQLATEEPSAIPVAGAIAELKYDGMRALWDGKERKLWSRSGQEVSRRFPELRLPDGVVLDGEVCIFGADGVSAFEEVLHRGDRIEANRLRAKVAPAFFIAFDVLEVHGESLVDRPFAERRERLLSLITEGDLHGGLRAPTWWSVEEAPAARERVIERGEEGLIYKRLDAPYRPTRNLAWVKWKPWKYRALNIERHHPTENGGYVVGVNNAGRSQLVAIGARRDQERLKRNEATAILVRFMEEGPDGAMRMATNRGLYATVEQARKAGEFRQ